MVTFNKASNSASSNYKNYIVERIYMKNKK
jgi:hypothetical protein